MMKGPAGQSTLLAPISRARKATRIASSGEASPCGVAAERKLCGAATTSAGRRACASGLSKLQLIRSTPASSAAEANGEDGALRVPGLAGGPGARAATGDPGAGIRERVFGVVAFRFRAGHDHGILRGFQANRTPEDCGITALSHASREENPLTPRTRDALLTGPLQPVRWLSGRKRRFAKALYGLNRTEGSNPSLTAISRTGSARHKHAARDKNIAFNRRRTLTSRNAADQCRRTPGIKG